MTLDECRAALDWAKVDAAEMPESADAGRAIKHLLDWAEGIQTFLEAVHEKEG